MSAHAILAVKGLRSRRADRQRLADVAMLGNEGWSLYGAFGSGARVGSCGLSKPASFRRICVNALGRLEPGLAARR
jgi:hypothetical protein